MPITRLSIEHIRILKQVEINLKPQFNIFFGKNGSGKSSILEAIHILGLGRSFRHPLLNSITTHTQNFLRLTCWLNQMTQAHILGFEKIINGKMTLRCDAKPTNVATIASLLPLQLIHPSHDELIQGSAKQRRQFIDWTMFHVEHHFLESWQRFHRILKQRNAALKAQLPKSMITCWDIEFSASAQQLYQFRYQSVDWLITYIKPLLAKLCPKLAIEFKYQVGWDLNLDLTEILSQQYSRDFTQGYTSRGPQRDELFMTQYQQSVAQTLSRGEQKLLIIALRLAQGQLLKAKTGKTCIFLLDDIFAELDIDHQHLVAQTLQELQSQVLLTTVHIDDILKIFDREQVKMFHVEHGQVLEYNISS